MQQYKDLINHIITNGTNKPTRAKLASTGEFVDAISVFGYQTRYNLQDGFPIITTKRIPFKAILHELIWFLRGDTNIKYLKDNNVSIWDEWADKEGNLGPVYGKQWRSWHGYNERKERFVTIDQIKNVIENIKKVKNDPYASVGRRLIVSAWNPVDIEDMALPPCHCLFQFMVTNGQLSCQLYQRSADSFLGVPFNIASYALLTHLIAHTTGLQPGEFIHTFGDLHIYSNHLEQLREQLAREPYTLPKLAIDPELEDVTDFNAGQVELIDYKAHSSIKGEVAV